MSDAPQAPWSGGATAWQPPGTHGVPAQGYQPGYGQAPLAPSPMPLPPGYLPGPVAGLVPSALPIEERGHPFFLRTPRWRWWKPLVTLLAVAVVAFIVMLVPATIGMLMDGIDFTTVRSVQDFKLGPWGFLGNNVGLALMIPLAMLAQWAFFGQRPGWLSSVLGRFRWGWFARCLLVVVPIWAIMVGVEYALSGLPPDIRVRPYTVLMIVGILLTTPFQAAGEEYLMRGLEQRLVASYFSRETLGWVIATIVSSLTFMSLHAAADPWLNVYYFSFGVVASWLAWKTGGLEAAVAIHVVNNLLSEMFMPFTDFSGMFDRGVGTADPTVLIQVGVLVVAGALLWWLSRRSKVVTQSAPGRAAPPPAMPQGSASAVGWQN